LKAEYKNLTGTDFTPGVVPISQQPEQNKQSVDILVSKINDQGNTVRSMKSNNASKVYNINYSVFEKNFYSFNF